MSRDVLAPTPIIKRAIYATSFGIASIIPKSFLLLIGYLAGLIAWAFDSSGRKTVSQNLGLLMPECNTQSIDRMCKKTYTNFGIATAEMLLIPRLKAKHFENTQIIDPWKQMNDLPAQGPLIAVSIHCNWEIMPCVLNRLGFFKQCHSIALSHEDPSVDALFNKLRENMGVHSLLLDRAPLETLRTLKAGGILALIADRDYTNHGVAYPLGGGHMKIPVGPAALAIQTQAPILPVFACRVGVRNYAVIFGKYITADPNLPKRDQIPLILEQLAQTYERFLKTAPSQWVCFHKAFVENQDIDSESD